MVQRVLNISPELGDLISEVIQDFVKKLNLGSESFDLWYHDEPVWIVRATSGSPGRIQIRRVQISAFRVNRNPELVFLPDAYEVGLDKKTVTKKIQPIMRRENRISLSLNGLPQNLAGKHDYVRQQIFEALSKAWESAQKLDP